MDEMRRHSGAVLVVGALLLAAAGNAAGGNGADGNGVDGYDVETDRADVEAYSQPAAPPLPPAADSPAWSGPRIQLLWFDPRGTLPGGFETVRQEVTRIFREIGVDVRWTLGGFGTVFGASDVPEVPVILLPEDPTP